jgi:uncharacterized membrane protein YdbT with pleckstrin-like domain
VRWFGEYAPIVPYPKRLLSPGESIVKEFRPHWIQLVGPIVWGLAAIVAIVAASVMGDITAVVRWVMVGVVVLVWLLVSVRRLADWFTTQYVITDERVIFRAGVLSRRGKEIPLEVINDVSFRQSIVERIVRSGDLLIESAGEMGQSRYSEVPHPEQLQSIIYQAREDRTLALRNNNRSLASELEKLAGLHRQGVLTDEEFEAQKRKLLGS